VLQSSPSLIVAARLRLLEESLEHPSPCLLVPGFVLLFRVFCYVHVLLLFAVVVVFLLGLLLEAVGALLCLLLPLAFCVFFTWFVCFTSFVIGLDIVFARLYFTLLPQ
jgi:hypothetical protein